MHVGRREGDFVQRCARPVWVSGIVVAVEPELERTRRRRGRRLWTGARRRCRPPTAIPPLPRHGPDRSRHGTREIVKRSRESEREADRAGRTFNRRHQAAGRWVVGSVQGVVDKNGLRTRLSNARLPGTARGSDANNDCAEEIARHGQIFPRRRIVRSSRSIPSGSCALAICTDVVRLHARTGQFHRALASYPSNSLTLPGCGSRVAQFGQDLSISQET